MVCDLTWSDRICYVNSPALSSYKYFSIDQVPLISSYIHKCRPIRSSAKLFYKRKYCDKCRNIWCRGLQHQSLRATPEVPRCNPAPTQLNQITELPLHSFDSAVLEQGGIQNLQDSSSQGPGLETPQSGTNW